MNLFWIIWIILNFPKLFLNYFEFISIFMKLFRIYLNLILIVVDILQELVVQIKTDTSKDSEEEMEADKALATKTKILYDKNKKLRAQQQEFRRVLDPSYHSKQLTLSHIKNSFINPFIY